MCAIQSVVEMCGVREKPNCIPHKVFGNYTRTVYAVTIISIPCVSSEHNIMLEPMMLINNEIMMTVTPAHQLSHIHAHTFISTPPQFM